MAVTGAVTKVCRDCNEDKPLEAFDRNPQHREGRHIYCKPCRSARRKKLYAAEPERIREQQIWKSLKHKYGITRAWYEATLAAQGGTCAICRGPQVDRRQGTRFCVDHDHVTGQARGLLCTPCNLAIGYLRDREDLLLAALDYLRDHASPEKVA